MANEYESKSKKKEMRAIRDTSASLYRQNTMRQPSKRCEEALALACPGISISVQVVPY